VTTVELTIQDCWLLAQICTISVDSNQNTICCYFLNNLYYNILCFYCWIKFANLSVDSKQTQLFEYCLIIFINDLLTFRRSTTTTRPTDPNTRVSALSSFQPKDHDTWIGFSEQTKLQTLPEKLMLVETVQGVFQLCQYLAFLFKSQRIVCTFIH